MAGARPLASVGETRIRLSSLVFLSIVAIVLSLFLGRYPTAYFTSPAVLFEGGLMREVLLYIRLPRVLTSFFVGMVLAAVGTVFQMVFRNPLVDSRFLGVTSGAAFGASLAIVMLGGSVVAIQGSAALFAMGGLAASYTLARRIRIGDWVLRLLFSGIVVSAFFQAGLGVFKYLADPLKQLPEITFWLLGGLWGLTWTDSLHIFVAGIPCVVVIYLMRWRLNLLSMQDDIAFSLTSAPDRERMVLIFAAVVATAAVVSKTGQLGWVGLLVPHIARRIVGSDAQRVLPWSLVLGGIFVLLCDDVSRTVLSGEIPIGILTSLSGAVFFAVLLMNNSLIEKRR